MTDVLVVSHDARLGGASLALLEMTAALRETGATLEVVVPEQGPLIGRIEQLGVPVTCIPQRWWVAWPPERWTLYSRVRRFLRLALCVAAAVRTLRTLRPRIVVSNTLTIPAYAIAARLLRVRHVWVVHEFGVPGLDLDFLLGYPVTARLIGWLSETVVCCSAAVEKHFRASAPKAATKVVYCGIVAPELPVRPRPVGPLRAILLGEFSPWKGQELAIRALALAEKSGADVRLKLVGSHTDEDRARLEQLADGLGIGGRVDYQGFTNEPSAVWRDADVALMCSRAEAFGRVTVEAMRAAVPVIGTDSGGTREIVENDVNGLLVPACDAEAMAAALVRLERDEQLRQRLASAAASSSRHFSPERYAGEISGVVLGS